MKILSLLCLITSSTHANQIYVTAQKVRKSIKETTNSVSIISSKEIESSGARSLSELLQSKAGIYISTTGSFGGVSTLKMRGTPTGFTKIVIDDFEFNDPSDIDRSFQINQLDLNNIESIEVLRGSQTLIYGSEAIGGVIKINTKVDGNAKSSLNFSYGTYDTKEINYRANGNNKNTSYTLGVNYLDTDGISSFNEINTSSAEDDSFNKLNLKGIITHKINPDFKLSYHPTLLKTDVEIDDSSTDRVDDDNSSYTQSSHAFKLSHQSRSGKIKTDLKFNTTKIDRRSRSSFSSENQGKEKELELLTTVFITKNINAIVGAEGKKQSATSSLLSNKIKKTEAKAIYSSIHARAGILFGDIGLRVDEHDSFNNFTTYKLGLGINLPFASQLKTTLGTGLKTPTLYQLNSTGETANLEPTEVKSYDITLRKELNKGSLELTYFNYEFSNQIAYESASTGYKNIGRSDINGGEISISKSISSSFRVNTAYTFTRTLNLETKEYLGKTPRENFSLSLEYIYNKNIKFLNKWTYVGEREDQGRMPSYTVADAILNFKNSQFKIGNILDKQYENTRNYGTKGRNYNISYLIKF